MKILRSSLMAFALFALAALWSCGPKDDPDPLTFLERIAGTWTIEELRINGDADNTAYTFSVTFNENGNYSISLGNLPEELKPNSGLSNSGSWTATSTGTSLTFTDATGTASVTLKNALPTEDTKELTNVTVAFSAEVEKVNSSIEMDLVK